MKECTMTNEAEVLAALDKPSALYALQQRLDPSNRSTDALQDLLMRMRAAGKVTFSIKTGRWSRA
jgi:hypothetical protein